MPRCLPDSFPDHHHHGCDNDDDDHDHDDHDDDDHDEEKNLLELVLGVREKQSFLIVTCSAPSHLQ